MFIPVLLPQYLYLYTYVYETVLQCKPTSLLFLFTYMYNRTAQAILFQCIGQDSVLFLIIRSHIYDVSRQVYMALPS